MVKPKSILIVENDETSNFIMKFVLNSMDSFESMNTVGDGKEACDYLIAHSEDLPQLLFLDLNMPGMSGWDFLDWYEENGFKGKMKVVIITSSVLNEDKRKAERYEDVLDFIDKPLTKESVQNILAMY